MRRSAALLSFLLAFLVSPSALAQSATEETASDDADQPVVASPAEAAASVETPTESEGEGETESGGADDMQAYAEQLRQRRELGDIHRAFGIATWGSMLVTVVLGAIQFHNLYGGLGGREDTPCVQGNAVFGQSQCWGVPYPHLVSAMATTAFYGTTFVLSLTLPDPDNLSEGDNTLAANLRAHKALRWVHLAGMAAQLFLGFANTMHWFGLDRANDFDAQRVLASIHQGVGWVTFGALSAAAALMIF